MKAIFFGGIFIFALHVGLPYLVATAAVVPVNSGAGQTPRPISDVSYATRKRREDTRLAIEQAGQWRDQDAEACSDFYDRPSEFAMCLHEEAYTRILFVFRRGCLGARVATCFEARP